MSLHRFLVILTTIVQFILVNEAKPSLLQELPNTEVLDDNGDVLLNWEVVGKSITFEVYAKTFGYVGFGVSPTGSMRGADIHISGVFENGTCYSSDRHATDFTFPELDSHQDWELLEAKEIRNSSWNGTYLKFKRDLDTCDKQDYPIGEDTSRLIWALGETDSLSYHGTTKRGSRSVNLLGAPMPQLEDDNIMEWKMTVDMPMPNEDTAYWCTFHRGPELKEKHQIVAFDAHLTNPDAFKHTHHFILYNCYKDPKSDVPLEDILGNYTFDKGYQGDYCYRPYEEDKPIPLTLYCPEYLYVWAKGGKKMVFPENVGYPMGEDGEGDRFYMLEIHYDNPEQKVNLTFETGVSFFYTNKTRDLDAGQLMIGHDVNPSILVPPNTDNFVVAGHCVSECTNEFPEGGLTVFNSLLHSHLSGRKLKIRQFRDEQEQIWPDFDNHYDFDYQQNRHLSKPFKILRGDHLTFECTYSSVWKNGSVVIGELSTRDEMCEAFLWYYPKMNIDVCGSSYNVDQSMVDLGITNFTTYSPAVGVNKIFIVEPKYLEGEFENSMSTKFNWTEEFKWEMQETRRFGEHDGFCFTRKSADRTIFRTKYPTIMDEYKPEDVCSLKSSASLNFLPICILVSLVSFL